MRIVVEPRRGLAVTGGDMNMVKVLDITEQIYLFKIYHFAQCIYTNNCFDNLVNLYGTIPRI